MMDELDAEGIAKRGVNYAAEMASIGIGALSEILLPNGMPEWLASVDPKDFNPEMNCKGAF